MAYLFSGKWVSYAAKPTLIALAARIGASLFKKLVQYHIPGRTPSLMDLIANTAVKSQQQGVFAAPHLLT